ncbi:MAG: hypothetical protein WA317_01440 [Mycobacterium sp.]|uniref:hypothetical protein n=1 Tax=Mycobacterium sp. TaxID=1785 RepID=UPI003CC5CCCF
MNPSKRSRSQRKAFNEMVRAEAKRRLHEMRNLNDDGLHLRNLSDALLDLAIDLDEYPAASSIARTMMGLNNPTNPVTVHIDHAARIDELEGWADAWADADTISEYLSDKLRARITELRAQNGLTQSVPPDPCG